MAHEAPSFKLFGTVISKEDKGHKRRGEEEATASVSPPDVEAAARAAAAAAVLPCPRCKSDETKFCYFNNYNVNQPRHFCKACHRYWTAGGTLRNVPVGAGRRRGRPVPPAVAAHRGSSLAISGGGVVEYQAAPPFFGQRWLLRPTVPARSEPKLYGGFR